MNKKVEIPNSIEAKTGPQVNSEEQLVVVTRFLLQQKDLPTDQHRLEILRQRLEKSYCESAASAIEDFVKSENHPKLLGVPDLSDRDRREIIKTLLQEKGVEMFKPVLTRKTPDLTLASHAVDQIEELLEKNIDAAVIYLPFFVLESIGQIDDIRNYIEFLLDRIKTVKDKHFAIILDTNQIITNIDTPQYTSTWDPETGDFKIIPPFKPSEESPDVY